MTVFDKWIAGLLGTLLLAACSPTLDWREVRVDNASLVALVPCRVERRSRTVVLRSAEVRMEMAACAAGGVTYAVGFIDVSGPAAVNGAVDALRSAAVDNIDGSVERAVPLAPKGATPNPQAARLSIAGRLPDGSPVQEHAAFFVNGMRVFQASVIGANLDPQAADTFFASLQFSR